jgi:hypothetical protein
VSPVKYKLGCYIPEDDILHSHRRESLKSYILRPSSHSARIATVEMSANKSDPCNNWQRAAVQADLTSCAAVRATVTEGGVRDGFAGWGNAPAVARFGVTLHRGECPVLETSGREQQRPAVPLCVHLLRTQLRCDTKHGHSHSRLKLTSL